MYKSIFTCRTHWGTFYGNLIIQFSIDKLCKIFTKIYYTHFFSVPILTLFNPHGVKMIAAAKISPNAKYIVTVGTEYPQEVNFWLWTYGKDEPDG